MANPIALARESEVFFVPESSVGTLAEPSASHLILTTAVPTTPAQERETFDDMQIRNTRSKLSPIAGRYLAGSWACTTYIKPNGTPGSAPAEQNLLKGLFGPGSETTDATTVTYALDSTRPGSYSIWFKDSHTVYMCTGATVNQGVFHIDGKNPGTADWSGGLMKVLWTGTDSLDSTVADTTSTTITPVNAELYSVDSVIEIANDTTGTEILHVTANDGTNLTVERGYKSSTPDTHAAGTAITPWLPTGTESGEIVHGRLGICTMDSSNYTVLTTQVTITNGIKYYEEEKNGSSYPDDYGVPEDRMVEAAITVYFRQEDTKRFYDALEFNTVALTIPLGETAGSKMTINLPQCKVKTPSTTGDAERIQELTLLPFATTIYDDEVNIVYS